MSTGTANQNIVVENMLAWHLRNDVLGVYMRAQDTYGHHYSVSVDLGFGFKCEN